MYTDRWADSLHSFTNLNSEPVQETKGIPSIEWRSIERRSVH
jgi:hypothetical protein